MSTVHHQYNQGKKRQYGTILNYCLALLILGVAIAVVIYLK